ncbi:MAG: type II toxin-antitoxin system ParD family antitoxin [Gammaproteobacteria bacterium]|nr:type II toxin-antitoxin system ParD family antitoxin [Gammaproteobacteria bacterium]
MTTMNISLPDALRSFVNDQVSARGYRTSSEYVRDLIRNDRDRQRLRGLLLEGAASPQAGIADADYFNTLRRRVRDAGPR